MKKVQTAGNVNSGKDRRMKSAEGGDNMGEQQDVIRKYQRNELEPRGVGFGQRRFRNHQHKDDKISSRKKCGIPQRKYIKEGGKGK